MSGTSQWAKYRNKCLCLFCTTARTQEPAATHLTEFFLRSWIQIHSLSFSSWWWCGSVRTDFWRGENPWEQFWVTSRTFVFLLPLSRRNLPASTNLSWGEENAKDVGSSEPHGGHLSSHISVLIQILHYGNNIWHPEIVLPAHPPLTLKIANIHWVLTMYWHCKTHYCHHSA